jgi:rhamnopyranosyl-N-acetylglucosaminyl-diphospho-decaprenol beta-1,3/1,4-galactofuranosyltransferase
MTSCRIAAVVVTHNRCALLQEHIAALRRQTRPLDAIYAVNVASTDETAAYLDSCSDVVPLHLLHNVGGAGGFRAGIERAVADGYDWVWCGDDDGCPADDALERLVAAIAETDAKWLNCVVVDAEDRSRPAFVMQVDGRTVTTMEEARHVGRLHSGAAPFNGTLIHRSIVEELGPPCAALFIWGDELEYVRRVKKAGKEVFTVTDAEYYHPAMPEIPPGDIPLAGFWKVYYGVRNAGATASADGRVRLSALHAGHTGLRYLGMLGRDTLRKPRLQNIVKAGIVLHGVLAACINDTRRRYR